MFLVVHIAKWLTVNLFTVIIVYIIPVMFFMTFLWRTTQDVVANIECTRSLF